jgi:hypothetical protein
MLEQFVTDLDRIAGREIAPRRVPPTDEVHAMHNPTTRDTVEVHVYGRDLHGLHRKTWADDGRVSPLVSSRYAIC